MEMGRVEQDWKNSEAAGRTKEAKRGRRPTLAWEGKAVGWVEMGLTSEECRGFSLVIFKYKLANYAGFYSKRYR